MDASIQPYSAVHLHRFVNKVGGIIQSNDRLKNLFWEVEYKHGFLY